MAQVRVGRYEATEGGLPDVCMKCGAPSTVGRWKRFSWYPPLANILILLGFVPYAIVVSYTTKRMTIQAPLCDEHKNHWRWRSHAIGWSFGFLLLLGLMGFIGLNSQEPAHKRANERLSSLFCAGIFGLGVIWLVGTLILQTTAIRPKEITERSITLKGVADAFAQALDSAHEVLDAEYVGPGNTSEESEGIVDLKRRQRRTYPEEYHEDED